MTLDAPTLLVAATAAMVLVLIGAEFAARRRRLFAARLARVCPRAAADRADGATVFAALSRRLEPLYVALMAAIFARDADRRKMAKLMAAAGFTGPNALTKLAVVKAALAVAGGLAGWAAAGRLGLDGLPMRIALIAGLAVLGSIAPERALTARAVARRDRLRAALPDALDLLVISANAGQSLDMALDRVAREMSDDAPDLAAELRATVAELQALPERAEALRNLAERVEVAEIRAFTMTLAQSVRYGSPFGESLRALGADLRAARLLAAEERGAKLPALLTLPLIIFIMPAVFVVVIGPAAVSMGQLFSR